MRGLRLFLLAFCLVVSGCSKAAYSPARDGNGAVSAGNKPGAPALPPLRPSSQVFCDAVQQRVAEQDCQDLEATEKAAKEGSAAFNTPNVMYVNQPVSIELAISPSNVAPTDAVSGQPGQLSSYKLKVGRHMVAQLVGQGFSINPSAAIDQEVTDTGSTTWEWSVTPQEKGPHTLTLKTVVQAISSSGKAYPLVNTVKNEPVMVKMTAWETLLEFVNGLPAAIKAITTIILAAAGLAGAYWSLKRAINGKTAQ